MGFRALSLLALAASLAPAGEIDAYYKDLVASSP